MALGYPLYVNGREVREPFTLYHGPSASPAAAQVIQTSKQGTVVVRSNPLARLAPQAARAVPGPRPQAGLGHPYRPGFGSTALNPLVAKRPGFGADAITAAMPGAVVIPKELASQVPESARIPAAVPTTKEGEILALVELGDGKYAWSAGSEGQFSAPTAPAPNYTHVAIAAGAGVGLTLLALKLFRKKR